MSKGNVKRELGLLVVGVLFVGATVPLHLPIETPLQLRAASASIQLRGGLRGGFDDSKKLEEGFDLTDENIRKRLNDSHFEYQSGPGFGGPGFRRKLPDELTCSALDAIRLRFVPRDALSNTAVHESFKFYPPLYAHQIFGEEECIYGYFSPEIDITYSEDSLLPAITFTHIPQQGYEHAAWSAPPGATDVLGAIQRKAPADYFSPDQLPPSKKRFEPRGKFLGDYSSYGLGRTREQHAAVESERGGDVRYEVFEIQAGPEIGGQKVLVQRAQSLAMWMIETASYIDFEDENWSCIGSSALMVWQGAEDFQEMTPRAEDLWESRKNIVHLTVSQMVVLPEFQGQGHGKQLLRLVYKAAQTDAAVLDLLVEKPTDIFQAMRQSVELEILKDKELFNPLRSDSPPWHLIQTKVKVSMPRLFSLAQTLGCKAGVAGVKTDGEGHPTVAGVRVDLQSVYSRAAVLGFTREELDDILQAIEPEDMQGTASAEEAADRLLSSVYMAIVSDVAEAQGLSAPEVDVVLGQVDPKLLLSVTSGRDIARLILPIVNRVKAGR